MRFCNQCGTQVPEETTFCNNCGAKLEARKTKSPSSASGNLPSLPALTKKTKIIAASVVAVLFLFFGAYKVGEAITDKDKKLNSFLEAVISEDVEGVQKYLVSADPELEVTEQHVSDLIAYFQEYPYEKEELLATLREQSKHYDLGGQGRFIEAMGSNVAYSYLINLQKEGKKFLLFDNYEFQIEPVELKLYTNYPDVSFVLDGNEVAGKKVEDGYISLGKFLPGNYKVKGILENEFLNLEKEIDTNLFYSSIHHLMFDFDEVYIETSIENASVFLNGKETGLTLSAYGEYFGPVLIDESMELHLEVESPFGVIKSKPVVIDGSEIYPIFTIPDNQSTLIYETIDGFITDYRKARIERDKRVIKHASSSLSESIIDEIDWMRSSDQYYIGYVTERIVDLDSVKVIQNEDGWFMTLTTAEDWEESYFYIDQTPTPQYNKHYIHYYLTYDHPNKKWVVEAMEGGYGTEFENTEVFTFKKEDQESEVENLLSNLKKEIANSISHADFEYFMSSYISSAVNAINARDFSRMSHFIDPKADAYIKEMSDYIDYLESRGIYEDFISTIVTDVENIDDEFFHVTTEETYVIYYESGSALLKTFESEYRVRLTSDGLRVNKLEKTTELSSVDY
ncbi:zinc ribbon domain-containing protein [Bacillus alkalicellulosilyticus]|uniref:zinc ribbon domain-containing protein n=1 Tax=Alkalihalobacterium alkalicellulosilyticum TaxID=1912214 RepID=UPI000997A14B|nr:zinc-ribbon domain-containing protein [Bacillus alkalicellulosilyticus]